MAKRPKSSAFNANSAAIEALLDRQRAAQLAEIHLRGLKKTEDADQVWEKNQMLAVQIDVLIGRLMEQWGAGVAKVTKELNEAKAGVDESVEQIKRNMQVAKQVVAILEALDDAIAIAAKFMV